MTIYDRIRKLRKDKGLTQAELGRLVGYNSRAAVCKIEKGQRDIPRGLVEKFAVALGVSPAYLMGWEEVVPSNIEPLPQTYKVPLLGSIACGTPILAEENIEGEVDVPEDIHADFSLRCKGDSMIDARIHDGDIVYIRKQEMVENGQIAAVLIEEEATLKRVYIAGNIVTLSAANPEYTPITIDTKSAPLRILGKAVGFTSVIK